jgi:hypothetical protein
MEEKQLEVRLKQFSRGIPVELIPKKIVAKPKPELNPAVMRRPT